MAQVEFLYNGSITVIQCEEGQKMLDICNKFINKSILDENQIYYSYDGQAGAQFNKNLTFNEMSNSFDKARKKMSILVIDNTNMNNIDDIQSKIKSKKIICSECNESIKMNIKNYKINLFECKNNHRNNNIPLNKFEKTQMINLSKIKCGICKEKNKSNTFNNEFYKCYECNMNLCPLCKSQHNKTHNILNDDKIDYICNKHNEPLINYCNRCKKNICFLCGEEHKEHEIISLGKMMVNKNDLNIKLEELKKSLNIFDDNINKIMEILNKVKENIENYYRLEEYIFNNYDINKRNYEILYNINELINYNKVVIKDINSINNKNDIENKFISILNLYNQINKNEIKLTLNIKYENINKEVYFLDNTDGEVFINSRDKEEHHHDFLKELNESNVELYIDNKKYKYQKYFIPEKEGIYEIKLKFNILIKDCSFMFYKCSNMINIDLSSFNTECCTNMLSMFEGCSNLTYLDLSSFNTKNVTNMNCMFVGCNNLLNVDLSAFYTKNVNNMYCMFQNCSKLMNINLTSFNTENVTSLAGMFYNCSNLKNINLSSFNTNKVIDMRLMFLKCSNLISIDLSSFNTNNVKNMSNIFNNCHNLREIKIKKTGCEKIINEINKKTTKIEYV